MPFVADLLGTLLTIVYILTQMFLFEFVLFRHVQENWIPPEDRFSYLWNDVRYLFVKIIIWLVLALLFAVYGVVSARVGYGLGGHQSFYGLLIIIAGSYWIFSTLRIFGYPGFDMQVQRVKRLFFSF